MVSFTPARLGALELSLSTERLNAWQSLAGRPELADWRRRTGCRIPATRADAIRLHEWNAALSAAILLALQILELTLRNRMHAALTAHFGTDEWWEEPPAPPGAPARPTRLVHEQAMEVQAVQVSLKRLKPNKPLTPGRIVAELPFGFWVSLTGPNYDNPSGGIAHWRSCLHNVFRGGGSVTRKQMHEDLDTLRKLRNRVAHHEPIVTRNLGSDHDLILYVLRRVDNEAREWVAETSLLPQLVKPDWLAAMRIAGRLIGEG